MKKFFFPRKTLFVFEGQPGKTFFWSSFLGGLYAAVLLLIIPILGICLYLADRDVFESTQVLPVFLVASLPCTTLFVAGFGQALYYAFTALNSSIKSFLGFS